MVRLAAFFVVGLVACGCGGAPEGGSGAPAQGGTAGVDAFDVPIAGLGSERLAAFNDGDLAFSTPLREADGLGPVYTRSSCDSCHSGGVRGPGLVQKMSVVQADGVTPSSDQSELPWGHTLHPLLAGGGVTPVLPPDDPDVLVTKRFGPPVLGRGYIEAVADSEIERVAAEEAARGDAIDGRVNHVTYASATSPGDGFDAFHQGDSVIGRFGLKARVATLADFVADAFQGDMGITSPMRPDEVPNPDGLTDDAKPGTDIAMSSIESRAMYVRLLAIPERHTTPAGAKLFDSARCSGCHTPALRTRADYPVAGLADIDAPIYSDLLLHRMGDNLADGLPAGVDGQADGFEWRTAPLIGLRFNRSYLHDGRAATVVDAIEAHRGKGSEANDSIDRFDALSPADEKALVEFVEAL